MSTGSDDCQISEVHEIQETTEKCADEEKEEQIDVERILHDVIHIVCKYVDGEDLNNMANVCQSWKYAVWREKSKRCYIQHVHLPFQMDNVADTLLDVNPSVSVVIYDEWAAERQPIMLPPLLNDRSSEYPRDDEEKPPVVKKDPPNKTIGVKVDQFCHTTDDSFVYCNLYGLFLPNVEGRFRVRAACIRLDNSAIRSPMGPHTSRELHAFGRSVSKQLVEELGLIECEHPNSTILFLGGFHRFPVIDFTLRNCVFDLCKRAQEKGKKITLASFFATKIVQADEFCRSASCLHKRQLGVVLSISGTNVESWSTFIFLYAKCDEIEKKLQQLKAKVKRKRHCTGLVSSARCPLPACKHVNHPSGNSLQMMDRIKRVFPDIPFVGSFANYIYWKRPNMSLNDLDTLRDNDVTQKFCFDRYVSIAVITYD